MGQKFICMDIGGSKILGAVVDENNEILHRVKKKTKAELGTEAVDSRIKEVIEELIAESKIDREDIRAIGAGAPGVIDTDKGTVLYAPNIQWKDHPLGRIIEEAYKVPFVVGNDVNVGVLGEWKYGAARGYSHALGIFVGTGIGGGIIIDNKLFTGSKFTGAEVGHMTLNTEGPLCNCGQRGCLEAYASKIAITREIKAGLHMGVESSLAEAVENKEVIKSGALKKAINEGDKLALSALDRAVYYLAAGAGNLINIFNPEVLVLGGGVMEALEEDIIPLFNKYITRFAWPTMLSQVKIKPSELKDDAIIYGARALINERLGF
ncbi:MAG: ROK family protein [Clostridia bacterium]|nr:ROK family protein [Clostridia bacterium]